MFREEASLRTELKRRSYLWRGLCALFGVAMENSGLGGSVHGPVQGNCSEK